MKTQTPDPIQLAISLGYKVTKCRDTFNSQPVFKLANEKGLYTLAELSKRLAN